MKNNSYKGLYVHIPFCVRKCSYCDFISFAGCDSRFEDYIGALINEFNEYRGSAVDTIFIGGGTPSVLPPYLIERLCGAIRENFIISDDVEWSMEVNPGTLDKAKTDAMLRGGINRVSVGVQSFNDDELKAAGRIHDADTAYHSICELHDSGFENISLDLMQSLPLQSEESFKKSLAAAVSLPVKHISVYSLIIEDGTPIRKMYDDGIFSLPDEDADRRMYHYTKEFLSGHNIERYEISNYAIKGCESRHNIKYWDCGEYIGTGVAAHSYIDGVRFYNTSVLDKYIGGHRHSPEREVLTDRDKIGEFMMLGMRKICGVSEKDFERRFNRSLYGTFKPVIDKYTRLGCIEHKDGFYRFTDRGLDVINTVLCDFV